MEIHLWVVREMAATNQIVRDFFQTCCSKVYMTPCRSNQIDIDTKRYIDSLGRSLPDYVRRVHERLEAIVKEIPDHGKLPDLVHDGSTKK